jgi:hypothetical protein
MVMSKKSEKNIEVFICTSMFLADQLHLTPEEIVSATLLIQKRQAKYLGVDITGLIGKLKEFLDHIESERVSSDD